MHTVFLTNWNNKKPLHNNTTHIKLSRKVQDGEMIIWCFSLSMTISLSYSVILMHILRYDEKDTALIVTLGWQHWGPEFPQHGGGMFQTIHQATLVLQKALNKWKLEMQLLVLLSWALLLQS